MGKGGRGKKSEVDSERLREWGKVEMALFPLCPLLIL